MSKPFALLVTERAKLSKDKVAAEAINRMNRWAKLSGKHSVSLDEVSWLMTLIYLGTLEVKDGPAQLLDRHVHVNGDGSRVVTIVADDGLATSDGAG